MNNYKPLLRHEVYDLLERMKEQVSAETILDSVVQWFSAEQIGECLQDLCETEYEIPNPYSEEEEDEEEEYLTTNNYTDMKSYELYETDKEYWANFSIVDDPRELSDFLCWAIEKAFFKMFPNSNCWMWNDGNMINEEITEYKYLGVTDNGILVLRVYEKETYEQTHQYIVKMLR